MLTIHLFSHVFLTLQNQTKKIAFVSPQEIALYIQYKYVHTAMMENASTFSCLYTMSLCPHYRDGKQTLKPTMSLRYYTIPE